MNTNPTAVSPDTFYMSVVETRVVDLDASAYLATGESISNVATSFTLISGSTPTLVTLADASTVSGNIVYQEINGPTETVAGGVYRLRVTFTASPSVNVYAMDLLVNVSA